MTFYEHAMLGGTLTLACGAHRRQGWGIVLMAATAAALPDWDGLSLAFGANAYSAVHRVWGHNLLACLVAGSLVGGIGLLCHLSARTKRKPVFPLDKRPPSGSAQRPSPVLSAHALAVWMTVGGMAGLCHLPADLIYSGPAGSMDWPLLLLWPFSERSWSFPLLTWGDLGPTLIFIGEMFALYRWRTRAQLIAWLALLTLGGYLTARWAIAALT